MSILFIVESPGKIAKISKILGHDYLVEASVGHVMDLDQKKMSINFDKNFEPIYVIQKPDIVKKLRSKMNKVNMVYLATDLDREGEAIAQNLYDLLKPTNYRRVIFNAITRDAITNAIKNAGHINKNLFHAQQARRVVDRLFGYLISPILSQNLGGKLSAGRVQSVATRMIVEKENEINQFINKNKDATFFKVSGHFSGIRAGLQQSTEKKPYQSKISYKGKPAQIPLTDAKDSYKLVKEFLTKCLNSTFVVHSISDKVATRSPAPPFETSTLQQEAHRKFGMTVNQTMKAAQKLYEGGYITYMRTDSVEISAEGHKQIKEVIIKEYGPEFYQKNTYPNKSANAQEAHEAIRPVHPDLLSVDGKVTDTHQIKLYKLIWQRTIASQMKPAKINVTTIQIDISQYLEEKLDPFYYFQSQIEKVIFPGFMIVYTESVDDPETDSETTQNFKGILPKEGNKLIMEEIVAKQEFLKPPPRFTEASLVKKLKEQGIGRPSTYVATIQKIKERKYIEVGNVPGIKKDIMTFNIKSNNGKPIKKINEKKGTTMIGKENNKIMPTTLGMAVNDFLVKNFAELMEYEFTQKMEENLDAVSNGQKVWHHVVKKFYDKLKPIVSELTVTSIQSGGIIRNNTDRLLGTDDDGHQYYAVKTKYGPAIKKIDGDKNTYASITPPQTFEDINLKDAIKLIEAKQSKQLAEYTVTKNGKQVKILILDGPYGPYAQTKMRNKNVNFPIPKNFDPKKLTDEQLLEILAQKKKSVTKTTKKTIKKSTKKPANTKK